MATLAKHLKQLALASILCLTAMSCGTRSQAIDRMVDELNSAQFRAAEARTGLFTDSHAELDGDTLAITFFCRPHLSLAGIREKQLPELQESALSEFRAGLANERLKNGIEALRDNHMALLLIWQDTHGNQVKLPLSPTTILE